MKCHTQLVAWQDPNVVFNSLFAHLPYCFWLDSAKGGPNARYSYMGVPAAIIHGVVNGFVGIDHLSDNMLQQLAVDSDRLSVLDFIDQVLASFTMDKFELDCLFQGGFVGYVSYDYAKTFGYPVSSVNDSYKPISFMWVQEFLVFDHDTLQLFSCRLDNGQAYDDRNNWAHKLTTKAFIKASDNNRSTQVNTDHSVESQCTYQHYMTKIKKIKQLLAQGETYEVCLTNQFSIKSDCDPVDVYLALRKHNPAPYAGFMRFSTVTLLSSSPENFFSIDANGVVCSEPIKGTRAIGDTIEATSAIKADLLQHSKEQAELLMITDLIRNDLAKCCVAGSLTVESRAKVTQYEQLLQLSSTISAVVLPDITGVGVFSNLFPGGSITGAPKWRTVQWIDQLEQYSRGVYTGAIGFFSFGKQTQFNVAIRTMTYQPSSATYQFGAGGAITYDSDPQSEWQEMNLKAAALRYVFD